MEAIKISACMPLFNKETYVATTIDSILEQTYKNWELIIVDDGSTDSSATVAKFYAEKDPRITYYLKEHSGIAKTRNFGNEKATGDWVAVVDADDISHPDRFKKAVKYIQKHDIDVLSTGIYRGTTWGNPVELWKPKKINGEDLLKGDQCVVHGTMMYRRDVILETPYRPEQVINDDFTLIIDMFKKGLKFGIIDDPTVIYRVLYNSVSKVHYEEIRKQCLEIAKNELC